MSCNLCNCCISAIRHGHLECLKLHTGCTWCRCACEIAAHNGQLECLKYLHEQGYYWDKSTCKNAADGGHLECLKYAHEQGCFCNEDTTFAAATEGHLNCLKYLHEQGCPWNKLSWNMYLSQRKDALYHGRLKCLVYLYKERCPGYQKRHYKIKKTLLKSNIAFFLISLRLKLYAIRFRKRFYSIDSKGFLSAKNHFSKITHK